MPFTDPAINEAHIYYEIAGEGATVVLLHAGIADSRMWEPQIAALAEHYRVIRYDLRGYGQTTAPAMPYSHHEDLRALLDQLGVERAVVIGCSNGGRVAMNFALSYPERTAGLGMICSTPGGFRFEGEATPLDHEIDAAWEAGDYETTSRLETQLWVVGTRRPSSAVPAAILDLVAEMNLNAINKEVAGVGKESGILPPAIERLEELALPVLVLVGEYDQPASFQASNVMLGRIAGARTVVIPDAAHLPNIEQPEFFNRILLQFLASIKDLPASPSA